MGSSLDTIAQLVAVCAELTLHTRDPYGIEKFAVLNKVAILSDAYRGGVIDHTAPVCSSFVRYDRQTILGVFLSEPLPPENPFGMLEYEVLSPLRSNFDGKWHSVSFGIF